MLQWQLVAVLIPNRLPEPMAIWRTTRIDDGYPLSRREIRSRQREFKRKRRFQEKDYLAVLEPILDHHEVVTHAGLVDAGDLDGRQFVLIRHDVDHDYSTALRMARWENRRGLRATYCLLHSAWYYGRMEPAGIVHTRELIQCAQTLQDLGHEVILHNNLVATALSLGVNPLRVLRQELEFFLRIGIRIRGTAAHGDRLCRELDFCNYELFRECCDAGRGGRRTLQTAMPGGVREVELGQVAMSEFGLDYEAYHLPRSVYFTDAGGVMKQFGPQAGRVLHRELPASGQIVQILLHPIWWTIPD